MCAILTVDDPEVLPAIVSFLLRSGAATWPRATLRGEGKARKTVLEMAQDRNMMKIVKIIIEGMVREM